MALPNSLLLYHYWRSTSSWRIRWALAHKKISYTSHSVNLLSDETERPDFRALNPMGYVPVIVDSSQTPSFVLTQSIAMLEWLEEKFPAPPLLPNDPTSKALVRSWVQLIASDTHPLQNLSAQERHSNDPVERKLWAQDWNLRGLSSFQKLIKGHSRTYCLGDQLTLADLCLIPQLYNARRFDVDLSELPELVRIESHCSQLKCYQESHPDRFQPPTITSS